MGQFDPLGVLLTLATMVVLPLLGLHKENTAQHRDDSQADRTAANRAFFVFWAAVILFAYFWIEYFLS